MITKEEYEKLIPYKPIIDLFMKSREYIGGGDGLFEMLGTSTRCPSCLSAALIETDLKIKQYESKM